MSVTSGVPPRTRAVPMLVLAVLAIACSRPAHAAQDLKNPREGDRQAILDGTALYRSRCAGCHGVDGTGVTGPSLAALIASGVSDGRLFQTIRRGIPGTEMPSSNQKDDEIWRIASYLRTLGAAPGSRVIKGNPGRGAELFQGALGCASCHRVRGRGGYQGPDLSRIGARRSAASLARKIRGEDPSVTPLFETVSIVTSAGDRIRGFKKNEDVYSIQIMDTSERLVAFLKSDLRGIEYEKRSLMPAFDAARLGESDLDDLVRYLTTLRSSPVVTDAPGQQGDPH